MANAEVTYREVPVAVPVEKRIVLELSEQEAATLLKVMDRVVGTPHTTRRKYTDAIGLALENVGVKSTGWRDVGCTGNIWFQS